MQPEVDITHAGMTIEQRKATLAPGERAYAVMPDGTKLEVVGAVPYDGSTRQQRRAAIRLGYVHPPEVPAGE